MHIPCSIWCHYNPSRSKLSYTGLTMIKCLCCGKLGGKEGSSEEVMWMRSNVGSENGSKVFFCDLLCYYKFQNPTSKYFKPRVYPPAQQILHQYSLLTQDNHDHWRAPGWFREVAQRCLEGKSPGPVRGYEELVPSTKEDDKGSDEEKPDVDFLVKGAAARARWADYE